MVKKNDQTKTEQLVRKAENHPLFSKLIFAAKATVGIGALAATIAALYLFLPSWPRRAPDVVAAESLIYSHIADGKGATIDHVSKHDLVGTGEPKEWWVEFTTRDHNAGAALFSLRGSNQAPLFYERGFGLRHGFLQYGDHRYIAVARNEGSGNYMDLRIFSLDASGQLVLEFRSPLALYQGDMYIREGKLLVRGDNRRFSLEHVNGKVELSPYTARLKYPDHGTAIHVLTYSVDENDKLSIFFDGQNITFTVDPSNSRRLENTTPVKISRGETILLDDNVNRENQIGTLMHHLEGQFQSGFYSTIIPKQRRVVITARDNYERFFDITIEVDDI